MFRKWQVYMGANDYVEMNEGLDSSMLASLGQRRRRRFLTGFCLVLALFIGAVWTASTPRAFQWLSRVAPPVAHFLRPTAGSGEESGILLELAEVTREGDTLRVHLTMKDLQGDRLKGRTNPEHWYYEQGRIRGSGSCVPYYDDQTGLLHLNLTCQPTGDFDWERWVTVTVEDLRSTADGEQSRIPIPLTLGNELNHAIRWDLTVTSMSVVEDELRVFVQDGGQIYRLFLTGPNGEMLALQQEGRSDGTWWSSDLRGRDIRECTLTAWVEPFEHIEGSWRIQVSPLTTD